MLEEETKDFYQVEMNLFSASLGSVSQGARTVHSRLNKLLDGEKRAPTALNNIDLVGRALYNAALFYGRLEDCVVITVTDDIGNAFDQDVYIEFFAERGIRNLRYSFAEVVSLSEFDEETGVIRV